MYSEILDRLPFKSTYRFVDHISFLSLDEVHGEYTLKKDLFFYEDHLPGNPITPGAILIEIMAQIGLVVLGINQVLNGKMEKGLTYTQSSIPLFTSTDVSFFKIVLPGEKVSVISKKQYFRFNKLKCSVQMFDSAGELVARGTFSGIIK
jgi:3-hydroxyacyl-[acyl-carrier-protein] dehydratase